MGKASEWRAKAAAAAETAELTLPSGMTITARRPDPAQLAVWGLLPASLVGDVAGGVPAPEDPAARMAQIRDLFVYCCVSPRISMTPVGEDEIHPREIPEADWLYVVKWALRAEEAAALTSFRTKRTNAGAGNHREDVDGPPQRTYVPDGPGDGSEL